jgi:TolA-binding protein
MATMKSRTLFAATLACLLFGTLLVGPAAAVDSSSDDLPEEAEVGSSVEATVEFTQLFDEFEQWTLRSETNLTNVTWTIRQFDQAGNQVDQTSDDGQSVKAQVDIEDGTNRIEVQVRGTTPEIENLSYDPPQQFRFAEFTQVRTGGTANAIDSYEVHHYTTDSKEAREAIDSASEAVESSGSGDAQNSLDSAIDAYEAGNFDNAVNNAERAESEASESATLRTGLLVGGVVIVLLVLLGGGYYLYKSRQQDPSRLR